ncbi:MAG: GNAT family N-acetyltransferase [Anaerolineales bacterium]
MNDHYTLPGSGIKIVPATWRDLMDLHQLEKACFQLDAWPLLDVMGVLTFPQIIRLKAVEEVKMVGFVAVDLRRSQQVAWIATLAVYPEYRKTGIGSKLLNVCEGKINLPVIRLNVRQSNQSAIELYRKHGYQQVDIWKSYYKGGDNALVFEKIMSD